MDKFQPNEVDDFMSKVQTHKKVVGSMFVTKEGMPIKTTMDTSSTDQYASLISEVSEKASDIIKSLDPSDELTFIRMHSKKQDIMIAMDSDKGYKLIVLQGLSK